MFKLINTILSKYFRDIFNISFKNFSKTKFLIINESKNIIDFGLNNYSTINPRKIYLIYFIRSLFKSLLYLKFKEKIKINYLRALLEAIKPEIVIGNNINGLIFELKSLSKDTITIMYQNNYILDYQIDNYKSMYFNKKVDYFCVFDNRHKSIFKKFLNCQYLITGSVLYNHSFTYIENYEVDILYISEFRNNKNNKRIELEKKILKIIDEYCKKKSLKLFIAFNSTRSDKNISYKEEKNFYDKFDINYNFSNVNSTNLASKSNLVVCLSSNLGIELLSSNRKILFLNILSELDSKFINPYFYEHSLIYQKYFDKDEIMYKLKFLYEMKTEEWQRFDKGLKYQIHHDLNNSVLKKLISQLSYDQ